MKIEELKKELKEELLHEKINLDREVQVFIDQIHGRYGNRGFILDEYVICLLQIHHAGGMGINYESEKELNSIFDIYDRYKYNIVRPDFMKEILASDPLNIKINGIIAKKELVKIVKANPKVSDADPSYFFKREREWIENSIWIYYKERNQQINIGRLALDYVKADISRINKKDVDFSFMNKDPKVSKSFFMQFLKEIKKVKKEESIEKLLQIMIKCELIIKKDSYNYMLLGDQTDLLIILVILHHLKWIDFKPLNKGNWSNIYIIARIFFGLGDVSIDAPRKNFKTFRKNYEEFIDEFKIDKIKFPNHHNLLVFIDEVRDLGIPEA